MDQIESSLLNGDIASYHIYMKMPDNLADVIGPLFPGHKWKKNWWGLAIRLAVRHDCASVLAHSYVNIDRCSD